MSYRDKLNAAKEARKKIKNTIAFTTKITVVVLAVFVLLATVLVIVDMVGDNATPSGGGFLDGGEDTVPPVIKLKSGESIFVTVGDTVSWREQVSVTDNSGSVTLNFNAESVNTSVEGTYSITYTATDAKGNVTEKTFSVVVKKAVFSYAEMEEVVRKKATMLGITSSMSKKEIVKAVYNYVNSPDKGKNDATFVFKNESNVPNIDRKNWETDWVEETVRAIGTDDLPGTYEGDCYTYYSVSKAFFEVFGIENKGIQRDFTSAKDGTHFWLMVNIGDSNAPRWYYYDATRLAGTFSDGSRNACLITLKKLQSYQPSESGVQLYLFDPTQYPTASTTEVK